MISPTLPPPGRSALETARDLRAKADRVARHGATTYAAHLRTLAARLDRATTRPTQPE